jgi:PEP-CTERM motif
LHFFRQLNHLNNSKIKLIKRKEKIMKKLIVLLSFLGFLGFLLTPNSYAYPTYPTHSWDAPPVEVTDPLQTIYFNDGPGQFGGGEFEVYSDISETDTYHLFNTFCVEADEYIDFAYGVAFHVAGISEYAVAGGKGGGGILGDPLDFMTAYLYHNFYWGTLSGYNYTFGSERDAEATKLQQAIWIIEQELDWDLDGNYAEQVTAADVALIDNNYLSLAWEAVNGDDPTWTGLGDVRVVNLTGSGNMQDQLTIVPAVPEPATMLLFGTGLIGLAGLGRKKFFKKS